jgi:hypothetical protein
VHLAKVGYSIVNRRRKWQGTPIPIAEGTAKQRTCFLLLSKEAIRGWRHVRRAARDNKDDIPAAFFYPAEMRVCRNPERWSAGQGMFFVTHSEVCAPRYTRVGNDVPDVGHSGDVTDQPLEAEPKPSVGHGAVAT